MNYPTELTAEILEIISEHDTRPYFISKNEGLVRDADKLWRFSRTGIEADLERFEFGADVLFERLLGQIPQDNFFYSHKSQQLAHQELERRKLEYTAAAYIPQDFSASPTRITS